MESTCFCLADRYSIICLTLTMSSIPFSADMLQKQQVQSSESFEIL